MIQTDLHLPKDLCKHLSQHLCSPLIECNLKKENQTNGNFSLWLIWKISIPFWQTNISFKDPISIPAEQCGKIDHFIKGILEKKSVVINIDRDSYCFLKYDPKSNLLEYTNWRCDIPIYYSENRNGDYNIVTTINEDRKFKTFQVELTRSLQKSLINSLSLIEKHLLK